MKKEDITNLLDKATLICVTKHQGQRDKGGAAYFQHPMRGARGYKGKNIDGSYGQ